MRDSRLRTALLDGEIIKIDGIEYVKAEGSICPGDTYFAERNSGPKILTCHEVNLSGSWIVPQEMAYVYDTWECVRVIKHVPTPAPPPGPSDYTWEVSSGEPLHPDMSVVSRMYEAALSDCPAGCKIYADPQSNARVLAHNSAYGCPR